MRSRWAALVLMLLALPGCAKLIDSDAVRLCRSLLPVLERSDDGIEVVQSQAAGSSKTGEQAISIDYRVPRDGRQSHRITCLFEPLKAGERGDPALGVGALLTSVITDDGALGPLRVHLLKQNWIARGGANASDPAPYANFGMVPQAPRWLVSGVQNFVSALPIISIYALLAAAYSLVYGLVGRINLAFGELTILAGYGAFLGFSALGGAPQLGLALIGAVVLGFYTGLSQGAALGRWLLSPLVGRPGQHVLIATIGLSLFWSELVRLTQGSSNRWMAPLFNRPLALLRDGDYVVTVTPMALILPVVAGSAGLALMLMMQRTRFGRRWRAFADDPKAAQLLGVDPQRLILVTMLAASACASLSGLLTTLYYGGVGFAGGQMVGLKALIAAIIGGIGSVPGALIGGIVLGLAETMWSTVFAIEYRDPAVFVALVVLLALRPEGLWRG